MTRHARFTVTALVLLASSRSTGAEPLAGWTFHNGPEFPGATAELRWNATEGHAEPGCAEVRYSFENGGNYVAAMMPVPRDESIRRARVWLKKPGRNRITFRAADHTGQSFQKFIDYEYPGWQQIEVDLSSWVFAFGGAADNKVRWPIVALGVLIENDGDARQGSYFIDDVEFLPARTDAASDVRRDRYVATDFAEPEPPWHRDARAGNAFDRGEWTYHLPNPDDRASLRAEFSFLGTARRLYLHVESDGSGHELLCTLYVHFNSFDRSFGRLTEKGEQTFMLDISDIPGAPIRAGRLTLVRRGEPADGRIRLLTLEAETEYAPHESIVLLPDGRIDAGRAEVELTARNLAPRPIAGTLQVELRDVLRRIDAKTVELTIPAGAKPVRQRFSWPIADRGFTEAAFRFAGPGVRTAEASVTLARPFDDVPPKTAVNPIGVGMYLYRWNGSRAASKRMREVADLARRAGIKQTREEFQWHEIEPRRGEFHWDFYDDLVRVADEHGIRVYGLLAYWSHFTDEEKLSYTERGCDEYARWAAAVVRRYKHKIKHWEIWNEPNIFFWSGPKELYPTLLKKAYATIKREDPDAKVLGCSTAGIDVAFIKQVLGAGAPFDILTVHPYRAGLNDLGFIDELKRTSELVGGRGVWITEMGWATSLGGTSEREQAGLCARTYLCGLASGVADSISWYDFRDDGDDPLYNEQRFGLLRYDLRPKAGYLALATIGRTLAWHKAAGKVELGDGVIGFRYAAPDQDVIALWSPDADRAVTLRFTPTATRAIDVFGQPIELAAAGPTFTTLPAGLPIYIAGPPGFEMRCEPFDVKVRCAPMIARPGEIVRVVIDPASGWSSKTWEWPIGWAPRSTRPDAWEVQVPADQPQGRVRIGVTLERDGSAIRVPASVPVQPARLRL